MKYKFISVYLRNGCLHPLQPAQSAAKIFLLITLFLAHTGPHRAHHTRWSPIWMKFINCMHRLAHTNHTKSDVSQNTKLFYVAFISNASLLLACLFVECGMLSWAPNDSISLFKQLSVKYKLLSLHCISYSLGPIKNSKHVIGTMASAPLFSFSVSFLQQKHRKKAFKVSNVKLTFPCFNAVTFYLDGDMRVLCLCQCERYVSLFYVLLRLEIKWDWIDWSVTRAAGYIRIYRNVKAVPWQLIHMCDRAAQHTHTHTHKRQRKSLNLWLPWNDGCLLSWVRSICVTVCRLFGDEPSARSRKKDRMRISAMICVIKNNGYEGSNENILDFFFIHTPLKVEWQEEGKRPSTVTSCA